MAESPALLEGYKHLHALAYKTDFTPEERTVVWMATNVEHACHYCVPAHTGIAKMEKIDDAVIEAARAQGDYADAKLQALKVFTLVMLEKRGWPSDEDLSAFFAVGFDQRAVIDLILAIAHKTLSNYTNHVVGTPVDDKFAPFAWAGSKTAAA